MLRIETVESVEGLVIAEERAVKLADARVKDWQRQISVGDCFKQTTSDGLEIFGEVVGQGWRENWLTCRCYSFVCPEGETGFVHISQINELRDRKAFESVKDKLGKAYRGAIRSLKEQGFPIA